MAVYTQLTNEDIAAFLESDYDIGTLDFAVGITQGVENTNYLIATQHHGAEEKYILTLYEKRVDPTDLPFFMGLMSHLHSKGIPCPLPIMRKQGGAIATLKEKHAAIISFLHGRSRTSPRATQIGALGTTIAQMHLAAEDYRGMRTNSLSLEGWKTLAQKILPRLDEIREGLRAMVSAELDFLSSHWPQHLPSGIIHADIFPDNVFFDEDTLTGVIDFYFACHDMFAYELAIVMNAWCFEHRTTFNLTKAAQLFAQYQRVRPLSEEEIASLPLLARGAALRFLLTRAHDWLYTDKSAQVTPKDPMEYVSILQFHQNAASAKAYGL